MILPVAPTNANVMAEGFTIAFRRTLMLFGKKWKGFGVDHLAF